MCSGAPSSGLSASTASGGSLLFIDEGMGGEGPAASIEVERSNEANYNSKPTWLNFTEDELKNTTADLMGNRLVQRGNPTIAEIKASVPPMAMSTPDSIKGDPSHGTAHTFVGQ